MSNLGSVKCPVQTSALVRLSAQLYLGANLNKREIFGDQFWKDVWKKFCDFLEKFICLTLFVAFIYFLLL